MDSEQQNMCMRASSNACTLEEMMLTGCDVMNLTKQEAEDIVDRCEQIIHCMRECFDA